MIPFSEYQHRYDTIEMERTDTGILLMRLHNRGGPYVWDFHGTIDEGDTRKNKGGAHSELMECAAFVARDLENRVIILTGTGDTFSGPRSTLDQYPRGDAQYWEQLRSTGVPLLQNLLEIQAPVISCINGPIYRHAEIPLLGDIVLCADDAMVVDSGHFPNRTVPGDGINLVMPFIMGWNRGRYFHLMGQELDAQQMLDYGLVNEVMPRDELLPRAWEIANRLAEQTTLTLRYSRHVLVAPLKAFVAQFLGFNFAMEALAAVDQSAQMDRADAARADG
jgi:enoyl-CoA hydratase/carnithine racemase